MFPLIWQDSSCLGGEACKSKPTTKTQSLSGRNFGMTRAVHVHVNVHVYVYVDVYVDVNIDVDVDVNVNGFGCGCAAP